MRRVWAVVLLGVLAASVQVAAGAAPREKVAICHYDADHDPDAPTWELLEIAGGERALAAHLGHGDAHPGDPVPGSDGRVVLDADCTPVATDRGLDVCAYADQQEGRSISRPVELTIALGEQLTTETSTSQADGKYDVGPLVGEPTGSTVRVIVSDSSQPFGGSWFAEGTVELGGSLVATAAAGGRNEFPANTWVHLLEPSGPLLQTIRIHTSCSTPIVIGDQFGTASLVGAVLVDLVSGERLVFAV